MSKKLDESTKDLCVQILRELARKLNSGKMTYKEVTSELRKRAIWIDEMNEIVGFLEVERNARKSDTRSNQGTEKDRLEGQ